jgi:hypothetical protein
VGGLRRAGGEIDHGGAGVLAIFGKTLGTFIDTGDFGAAETRLPRLRS